MPELGLPPAPWKRWIRLLAALLLAWIPAFTGLPPLPLCRTGPGMPAARLPFRSFGVEQGLRNLNVLSITQDRDGFLWAGTENGLFRYDGSAFRHYSLSEGLPGLFVYTMACGSDGLLWVGTDQGLACYACGRIRSAAGEIGRMPVNALAVGAHGRMWAGTNQGLFVGDRAAGFAAAPGWHFGSVHALLAVGDALWAGSERGLVELRPGGAWRFLGREQGLGEERIFALALDRMGRLWVRATSRLWMRPAGGTSFTEMSRFAEAAIPGRGVSLFVDRRGRLWVPSKDQVAVLDGERWSVFTPQQGMPTSWVQELFQDAEGSIWIAGVGLHQLLGGEAWTFYSTQSGLPSDTVWAIHRDRRGTLWAGTNQGMAKAMPTGWKVLHGTEKAQTVCMAELPNGHLVASGSPAVLFEWAPESMAASRHPLPVRQGDKCLAMALDRRGRLWICTRISGLLVGERTGSGWTFKPASMPESQAREEFTDLDADSEGSIWVITQSALYHFDERGCWRYTTRDGILPNPYTLGHLAKGEMLLSSRSTLGWIRFRQGEGGLEILERQEGGARRLRDPIYVACLDARGRIWLGGGLGLEVRDRGEATYFTSGDGLLWCDVNRKAILAEPGGDVWIGTGSGGLAHYREGAAPAPSLPPPTRIWEASLGDRRLDLADTRMLAVPFRENLLRVQFSCLGLQNPARLQVQTRLLGLDPVWRPAEGRSLAFPGLGPGWYRFEARARYEGGPWGACAALAFRIRPPWWRSWPALLVQFLLACAGVWGVVRYRTHRLAVRNRILHERVEDATREILRHEQDLERVNGELREMNERQKQFLGIAAHDLRNPLSTIAMAAEMLEDEGDPGEIRQTARMIREESLGMSSLVGRFLDIAALETGKVKAECVRVPLSDMADRVLVRHRERARSKGIELANLVAHPGDAVMADPKLVQEILDNLISNAIKFSFPGSRVTLRLEARGAKLVCSVEDQGPGLSAGDREKLFGRYAVLSAKPTGGEKSTGLGLFIVRQLVELQGGRIWVDSEPGHGAAFRIELSAADR